MKDLLREQAIRFVLEVKTYDQLNRPKPRTRQELRQALLEYWEQETSAFIGEFINSSDGEYILNIVNSRYNKALPKVGVRYGASGYHK